MLLTTMADEIANLIFVLFFWWLMLLPHDSVVDVRPTNWSISLADVIAKWQMEKPQGQLL